MTTSNIELMSSDKIRNIVVLGSTGSGRSSTCNTLYGTTDEPFIVGHEEVSCTKNLFEHYSDSKKLRIFDTPGFGDNRNADKKVERTLRQLSSVYSDTKEHSSKQIDAFLLVIRMTPRAQNLRTDLEKMKEIFGLEAFKSMVLMLVYSDNKPRKGSFLDSLNQMDEVKNLLAEGKQEEPSEDWFCVWDNISPREGQEAELLEKIGKLKAFDEQAFIEAEKRGDKRSGMKVKLAKEEEMSWSKTDLGSTMEDVDERKAMRSQTYTPGDSERDYNRDMRKVMELMELKHLAYTRQLHEFLIRNGELMETYMDKVKYLENRNLKKEAHQDAESLVKDWICKRRKPSEAEKEEIVGDFLKQGSKQGGKKTAKSGAKKGAKVTVEKTTEFVKEEGKDMLKSKSRSTCGIF